jgi:ABC-2 type transport system ATP-binding protein
MRIRDQLVYLGRLHGMTTRDAGSSSDLWLERLELAGRGGDKLEALSHGNQQRVQLAAALVHDPELAILDEPFSGLDPIGVDVLSKVLADQAASGVTVVFSSHQLDLVEDICESVAIINRGRLVMSGRVHDLRSSGQRLLAVSVRGAGSAWASAVPGATVVDADGSQLRLLLDAAADPQAILARAQEAGPVEHFAFELPSLSELFLKAVAT